MKKLISLFIILVTLLTLTIGCTPKETTEQEKPDATQEQEKPDATEPEPDTATGPSYVTDEASIQKVMGPEGRWIVIFTQDMKTDKELVLDGEFRDKDDPAGDIVRKVKLYAQDEERTKTASYTLTAPKLTIKSENAMIEGGTFVGDVYVEANGFTIRDAQIQGNVYFSKDEYKTSSQVIENGKVTGTSEVK